MDGDLGNPVPAACPTMAYDGSIFQWDSIFPDCLKGFCAKFKADSELRSDDCTIGTEYPLCEILTGIDAVAV